MKKGIRRPLSLTGLALIGLSVVLYASLELSSRWEQTNTPGEKNIGVAIFFMIFGIPMLISAAAGVLCLLVGALAFVYMRVFPAHFKLNHYLPLGNPEIRDGFS